MNDATRVPPPLVDPPHPSEAPANPAGEALTPAALQRFLRSAVFGHRVFYYPTIGSTNDRALDLAAAGEPEGGLVLAEEQTSGKGRRDRSWHSCARVGIYASLILRPRLPAPRAPLFTFTAAVSVAAGLREACGLQVTIKWPNDIQVGARKIAGILGETRGSEVRIQEMVIGMGVNVNHAPTDFPAEVRHAATSVLIETRTPADRAPILAATLEAFERRYRKVLQGRSAEVLEEWESLSIAPRGRHVVVEGPEGRREGRVLGVDDEGALLLEAPGGAVVRLAFGEIVRWL